MTERIIIAGAGGQGVMLLGKIIAEAAVLEKKFVTWLPAYGAEVRGGTANCTVIISDEEIGSPFVTIADSMIILNQPSFYRFKNAIKTSGIMLVNSSLAEDISGTKAKVIARPFSDAAFGLGNIKAANTVALGAFVAQTRLIKEKTAIAVMQKIAPKDKPELLRMNLTAFDRGMQMIKGEKEERGSL